MSLVDIIKEALHLKPEERYIVIENLIKSLNVPDEEIEKIWIKESQKRFKAYKEGTAKTVSYDQVFGK
ncbi:addiction module protein [Hydrogenimonas thermophila]|uniref:Putative addiction module component n=1 Tax=Hydrogenimonas thermophila TaxID=223786 RepID=A0A1I5STB2_9BACT|nr:addiction module protein [Hydrogenimonas thermophila]WOE70249.1 addiction module protein [Hydrogenimonas thermophila]WOE72766.1 addiction module protein [Hydrogenimonas thermophila]SFP73975.1 Putative addiction module component [Hydrogenimonas thermophila]